MEPWYSRTDVFQRNVNTLFGERNEDDRQVPTSALGRMAQVDVLFMVKQGGPVTMEDVAVATLATQMGKVIDARELVNTSRKKSEWTGYHAETMILSAMLQYLSCDLREMDVDYAKALLGSGGSGPTTICANAPCCKHCANLLDRLEIAYNSTSGKAGLTGWWNPFTDEVYAHSSPQFNKDIPGF